MRITTACLYWRRSVGHADRSSATYSPSFTAPSSRSLRWCRRRHLTVQRSSRQLMSRSASIQLSLMGMRIFVVYGSIVSCCRPVAIPMLCVWRYSTNLRSRGRLPLPHRCAASEENGGCEQSYTCQCSDNDTCYSATRKSRAGVRR